MGKADQYRVPPQCLEAEKTVLASILLDCEALYSCSEHISGEDFYSFGHQIIFKAMAELNEKGEPIDLVTLNLWLEKNGHLGKVGGAAYISQLVDEIPTAANVTAYAKYIREKSILRKIIDICTKTATHCYQPQEEVSRILDYAEKEIFSISEHQILKTYSGIKDVALQCYKTIENNYEHKGQISGIQTGFKDFDSLTLGLNRGDLVVVAGRPAMGKTAFAMNIVENACHLSEAKVLFFSLEMNKESIGMRILSSIARINSKKLRSGDLQCEDFPKIISAMDKVSKMAIMIDDQSSPTTLEIRAKSRRVTKEMGGIDLILIDYLQLIKPATAHASREQDIAEISSSLKALAKELNVPVIAVSQLNRSVESRTNKRPMMSDLRESGAIEQDADLIIMIYRDEYYYPESSSDRGMAEIIVGKHRNGEVGTVKVAFLKDIVRFEDLVLRGMD